MWIYYSFTDSQLDTQKGRPNKALQLTPSRIVPFFYDRSAFPFTSFLELGRPFGVAELGVGL
jgi:hypothetical protein